MSQKSENPKLPTDSMATIKKNPLHKVIFWEWPDDALQLYNAIDHSVFKSVPSHLKIDKKKSSEALTLDLTHSCDSIYHVFMNIIESKMVFLVSNRLKMDDKFSI